MERNFFLKNPEEVSTEYLLLYTLAKLGVFAQFQLPMFKEENLLQYPPTQMWRYVEPNEDVYNKLANGITTLFVGNLKWVMYKGGKNYVIEPKEIFEIRKTFGMKEFKKYLDYSFLLKAVDDVPKLCAFIDDLFDTRDKRPIISD